MEFARSNRCREFVISAVKNPGHLKRSGTSQIYESKDCYILHINNSL
jgi:hypothetical protein